MTPKNQTLPRSDALSLATAEDILEHKWMLRMSAALGILLGIFAILMPLVATFAVNLVVGAILACQGMIDAVLAFKARSTMRIAAKFLLAIVTVAAGVLLFLFPVIGVLSLTIWLAAYFAASGLVKGYWAFKLRPAPRWGWMLFSAALGIAFAALIVTGLPTTAFWVLGLFVGVDLIVLGFATLTLIPRAKDVDASAASPSEHTTDNHGQENAGESDAHRSNAEAFIRQPATTDPSTQS